MVLVACEESQAVCLAFREIGCEAFSADLQDCSGGFPEWHIKGDCLELIDGYCSFITQDGVEHFFPGRWDLLVAHPPCTYLSNAGANRLRIDGEIQEDRMEKARAAKDFFMRCLAADAKRVAVENPVAGAIHQLPPYSQLIHPWMFGDPWQKKTCLWLRNLPILMATDIVVPQGKWCHTRSADFKDLRVGVRSAKERSKTFPGIAHAMAAQWGKYL